MILTLTNSRGGVGFEHRMYTVTEIPTRYCEVALMELNLTLTKAIPGRYMFVYCDIINPRLIGDTLANLLRVIPLQNNNISQNWISTNPYYFAISLDLIDNVCISLRNEFGDPINIDNLSLQATFNIRKQL